MKSSTLDRPSARAGLARSASARPTSPRRRAPRRAAAALAVAALLALTGAARAQETAVIDSLSVSEATVGTIIDIAGSGFSTKTPKVELAQDGVKAKSTKLKVRKPVADDLVSVEVTKGLLGTFTILLDPADKNVAPVESKDTVDLVPPTIVSIDDDVLATPKADITMTVDFAADSGRRVEVAGRKATIVSVVPLAEGSTQSRVTFRVPKKTPNGTWDVEYSNSIGADVAKGALPVAGSTQKLPKPQVLATIEGSKSFKVTKAKKITVSTSLAGPTTVNATTGGNNARDVTLVLPFVLGSDDAPQFYSSSPASIHYQELTKGTPTLELESVDEEFLIVVSAASDGRVAGSFCGTLYSVGEGGETREISGTFSYDGTFALDDGGGDTPSDLPQGVPAPGLTAQILDIKGAKGATGNFQPGDKVKVTFRLGKDDSSSWHLDEMTAGRAAVSGPTFNYQRVIAQTSDVRTASVQNKDDTYTYTFPTSLPDEYLPPLNDSDSFGPEDGELQGQPLLDGTYTVALWFEWSYTSGGQPFKEVGTATADFLLGPSVAFPAPREVVTTAHCDQCHSELQFHGGGRRTNELCVMCHTAGAEDKNIPEVAGGTPGVTIQWSVMIHKIHNGAHLPTVLGVTTEESGARDYTADPVPYQLVGFGNKIVDYSDVEFPAWPNIDYPMPRDAGYNDSDPPFNMTDVTRALEDQMRRGVTNCDLCHGDPDGPEGPIKAPANGDLAYTQLRRSSCGSCHDDWVFDRLYTSNLQTMPAQLDDSQCSQCHAESGSGLAVRDGHLHPLLDSSFAAGIHFDVLAVSEGGTPGDSDGDGTIDAGEKVAVTFTLEDDAGMPLDPGTLSGRSVLLAGPSNNMNVLVGEQSLPPEVLTGPQPFTVEVPMRVYLELLGDATPGTDVFTTAHIPHWNVPGHLTEVRERTGLGAGASTLSAAVTAPVNFIDVDDSTGFLRDDFVVIDDGTVDGEYLQIQVVEGNRLWFSSPQSQAYAPGPVRDHVLGAPVLEVVLDPLPEGVEYDLDEASGTITETGGFGDGNAIVTTYSSDFVMPDTYPLALNAGPDLTEVDGGWAGKSLVDGTYSLTMWGSRSLTLDLFGESNSYREGAPGASQDFLVGDVTMLEPYDLISSGDNCSSCHVDLQFHGGNRRGWSSCLSCHGTAASGDRPRYVAANAPPTDGVTINFRELVHKIHRGSDLANADTYTVVGFGTGFPDNFSEHTYGEVVFPSMPSRTQNCRTCHGEDNTAWLEPQDRQHPTEQGLPVREWNVVCGACHDSASEQAHIESNSSPVDGAEACATCHSPGKTWSIDRMHLVR